MHSSLVRGTVNRALHVLARILPGATTVRPWLHRARGVHVGRNVFIGDDVYLENEYPCAVEIQNGVQISVRAIILAHTGGAGRIVIEKGAFIGPNAVLVTSRDRTLRIGEGAVIGAGVVVTQDIPAHAFVVSTSALAGILNRDQVTRKTSTEDHRLAMEFTRGTVEREQIRECVFRAMARVNELTLDQRWLTREESVVLLGEGAALDSMNYVNFVVALEEEISHLRSRPLDVVALLNTAQVHAVLISTAGQLIDFIYSSLQTPPLS